MTDRNEQVPDEHPEGGGRREPGPSEAREPGRYDNSPGAAVAPRRAALARNADRSWLALVPRRNLLRVALMLLILVVVIALRYRAGSIAASFEAMFGGPAARPAPGVQSREPPRVRLAPPPAPGARP